MGTLLFLGYTIPLLIVCICGVSILLLGVNEYEDNTLVFAVVLTVAMGLVPILNIAVAIQTVKAVLEDTWRNDKNSTGTY